MDQDGNIVQTADTSYRRQVISEETSAAITDILQQNVESGSATGGYGGGLPYLRQDRHPPKKVDKWNEDRTQDMEYNRLLLRLRPGGGPPVRLAGVL